MKPVTFAGVEGVQIVETVDGRFAVQTHWCEDDSFVVGPWRDVGEFPTLEMAIEMAPYLCEF